jgi:hypothetical protein
MEDNSDVYHSLESSDHTVGSADVHSECLLRKLQVGNADKGKEEIISAQIQSVEGTEQLTPSQLTTRKSETVAQNSVSNQETVVKDTVKVKHLVEDEGSNLEAAEALAQKSAEFVDIPEEDVEEREQIVTAESKHS